MQEYFSEGFSSEQSLERRIVLLSVWEVINYNSIHSSLRVTFWAVTLMWSLWGLIPNSFKLRHYPAFCVFIGGKQTWMEARLTHIINQIPEQTLTGNHELMISRRRGMFTVLHEATRQKIIVIFIKALFVMSIGEQPSNACTCLKAHKRLICFIHWSCELDVSILKQALLGFPRSAWMNRGSRLSTWVALWPLRAPSNKEQQKHHPRIHPK